MLWHLARKWQHAYRVLGCCCLHIGGWHSCCWIALPALSVGDTLCELLFWWLDKLCRFSDRDGARLLRLLWVPACHSRVSLKTLGAGRVGEIRLGWRQDEGECLGSIFPHNESASDSGFRRNLLSLLERESSWSVFRKRWSSNSSPF